ncbi:MAG: serine/threonine-protein kinase [Polyangiaceae bacterium]
MAPRPSRTFAEPWRRQGVDDGDDDGVAGGRATRPASVPEFRTAAYVRVKTFGRYRIISQLGSGGMGDVFLAVMSSSPAFEKLCVVKRLRRNLASNEYSRRMFANEAQVAARLNHPNIVQTYEVGEEDGAHYLAMEYVEGQTLRDVLVAAKSAGIVVDPAIVLRIVADALSGLHYAHELRDFDGTALGIIHRDISPHNVVVSYEGDPKLIDFGVAKISGRVGQSDGSMLTGKVGYMAPEYIDGNRIDRRADLFSMGVVLWEALAGEKLPDAMPVRANGTKAFPRLAARHRRIDPEIDGIVAKALAVDPADRYPTAMAMRDAIEERLARRNEGARRDVRDFMEPLFAEDRVALRELIRVRSAAHGGFVLTPKELTPSRPVPSGARARSGKIPGERDATRRMPPERSGIRATASRDSEAPAVPSEGDRATLPDRPTPIFELERPKAPPPSLVAELRELEPKRRTREGWTWLFLVLALLFVATATWALREGSADARDESHGAAPHASLPR